MNSILYSISDFSFTYPFSYSKLSSSRHICIYRHDVILVTGVSGAGKSTLLYALKGLFPDIIAGRFSGTILFNGVAVNQLPHLAKLKIGLVQQNPDSQMISRLVRDELAFGMENLQIDSSIIEQSILTMTEQLNLSHLLERELSTLSGGEKQKIALLSVLLTDPEVILLDEPTAYLDPQSAVSFMQLLHQISNDKTIIIVEHNTHYVADMITRCLFIDSDGNLQEAAYLLKQLQGMEQSLSLCDLNTVQAIQIGTIPLLEVRNLSYRYLTQNKPILNQLSFSIYSGDICGIIGRSGAGKSTLLKLLARFINSKNHIFLDGKEINSYSTKGFYSQVGLLFQNPENHFLHSSVFVELDCNQELLELFDLTKVKEQNPFTLSEGQKRRLSLAILSLGFERRLYLLDEPTFGQDEINKNNIIALIRNMQQQGATFIIVSHDYQFISSICNRVINFSLGY